MASQEIKLAGKTLADSHDYQKAKKCNWQNFQTPKLRPNMDTVNLSAFNITNYSSRYFTSFNDNLIFV